MSAVSPGPLLAQPSPPWRVVGSNIADAANRLGTSFYYGATISGVQTIVTPGANAAGLVLRSVCVVAAGGFVQTIICADASAPSSFSDTTRRTLFSSRMPSAAPPVAFAWYGSLLIPAGLGLYIAANSAEMHPALTWDAL